jgi:hypothetical protein
MIVVNEYLAVRVLRARWPSQLPDDELWLGTQSRGTGTSPSRSTRATAVPEIGVFVVGDALGPDATTVPLSSLSIGCPTTGNSS